MNVPMLDENEFAVVADLYSQGIRATKEFRQKYNIPLKDVPREGRFVPMLDAYEKMTGFRETNPNAVIHHRISTYGPPCPCCEKVLRTPVAFKCFECGYIVHPTGDLVRPPEPCKGTRRICAQIRYLLTDEGGRQEPVFDGYRGQFHYEADNYEAHDGFQRFPSLPAGEPVPLGKTVPAVVDFDQRYWDEYHSKLMKVGMRCRIQEGGKVVGRGVITYV